LLANTSSQPCSFPSVLNQSAWTYWEPC
jgi:hypothetical protein